MSGQSSWRCAPEPVQAMLSQNVSDGAARNLMAQIGQGALDPRVAPIPVLRGHSDHQPLDLVLEAGPAGASPLAAIILPSVSVRPYQVGPQRCSRRSAIGGCETQFGFTVFKGLGWWPASYRVGARQYGSGASPRRVCARRR